MWGGGIVGGAMSGVGGGDRSDSSVLFLARKQSSTYLPMDEIPFLSRAQI